MYVSTVPIIRGHSYW